MTTVRPPLPERLEARRKEAKKTRRSLKRGANPQQPSRRVRFFGNRGNLYATPQGRIKDKKGLLALFTRKKSPKKEEAPLHIDPNLLNAVTNQGLSMDAAIKLASKKKRRNSERRSRRKLSVRGPYYQETVSERRERSSQKKRNEKIKRSARLAKAAKTARRSLRRRSATKKTETVRTDPKNLLAPSKKTSRKPTWSISKRGFNSDFINRKLSPIKLPTRAKSI